MLRPAVVGGLILFLLTTCIPVLVKASMSPHANTKLASRMGDHPAHGESIGWQRGEHLNIAVPNPIRSPSRTCSATRTRTRSAMRTRSATYTRSAIRTSTRYACPSSNLGYECPAAYSSVDDRGCTVCAPFNCGGFAGQQCNSGLVCVYPVGFDAGYCHPSATPTPALTRTRSPSRSQSAIRTRSPTRIRSPTPTSTRYKCPPSNLGYECPAAYSSVDNRGCTVCAPPNCGGFAGQPCENGFECFYPVGFDAGFCLIPAKPTPSVTPSPSASTRYDCPSSDLLYECPPPYSSIDDRGCTVCAPPNCGGFAGQQCENGLECFYPVGFDAGFCLPPNKPTPVATRTSKMCGIGFPPCENGLQCVIPRPLEVGFCA
eukprot:CAMPEP_0184660688 /NCGR_PEP_ID=MMETSP0308-20130426/34772_1 /TAXON_ID=38269 /ORGANISM="Gloeochaete witrockiana, Strain SAG 46.84" /LENGTH=372 /DNA_ID=CAMNT_0027101441 /DNA_START=379 /DNA_END=1497 /DNA_ORIENTATION=-